jgi:tetratricopeptide (TPR) repeat protein
MRIITLLLIITIITEAAAAQGSIKKAASSKREVPAQNAASAKSEIQSQMTEATNEIKKEIADLEKQLKSTTDPDEIKDLKEQIAMLQKQLAMMQGLNKQIGRMSDAVVEQGAHEDSVSAPKRDIARISILPKRTLTEAELLLFLKNVNAGVEKMIPPAERAEALNLYNETKAKYKSTGIVANSASGCWMLGHWEKALYIIGKACLDDITDADNLNNYAAFLIMSGGEQAALPILDYLNEQYPNNSTILNNIGQAWFGLGDIDNAKKYLNATTELYPNHSMANSSLSDLAVANNDPTQAISFLKASLKETYDPETEARLRKLGYEIKFADMPTLNYPMKKDPYGFIPLINSWNPDKIQSSIADGQTAIALQAYVKGVQNFNEELDDENVDLEEKLKQRGKKLSFDSAYRTQFLQPYHNSPAYLLAARSMLLYCIEHSGLCIKDCQTSSPLITALWLPSQKPYSNGALLKPIGSFLQDCEKLWVKHVDEPMAALAKALPAAPSNNCADEDAKMDAFLAKRKQIYSNGVKLIQDEFSKQSEALTNYIKYSVYADLDDPDIAYEDVDPTYLLLAETDRRIFRRATRNKYYHLLISLILKADKFEQRYKTSCGNNPTPDPDPAGDVLAPLKVRTLDCEYIKHVITPAKYEFKLQCNTVKEKTDPKLKKRYPDVNKGSANSTNRRNPSRGPMQSPRGPNTLGEIDEANEATREGPLTSENKDMSQFSLEYNKWGNLVGFNFQLNDDGTALKDPGSLESDVDSRWSWNAIASPKKGHMNKLLMK